MRFVKPIIILVILGIAAAFIWQNLPTLSAEQPFAFSLYFGQPFKWTHPVYFLLALAAIVGFLLGVVVMLKPFRSVRKKLAQERLDRQAAKAQQEETADALEPGRGLGRE
jgi:uncharacterized integral membrane protein